MAPAAKANAKSSHICKYEIELDLSIANSNNGTQFCKSLNYSRRDQDKRILFAFRKPPTPSDRYKATFS